jgi:hypothetical protein
MSEFNLVIDKHNEIVLLLEQHLITDIINIISDYSKGFVRIGKLYDYNYLNKNLYKNYISCAIRYFSGLTFFDFWHVDLYDDGCSMFSSGWEISHYTFIYKNNVMAHDKIKFLIVEGSVPESKISMPIYNIKKLENECFYFAHVPSECIQAINMNDINKQSILSSFKNLYSKNNSYDTSFYKNIRFSVEYFNS